MRVLLISAAVLAPVYWHRTIAAGDLGSHLYNAWLAQLIRHGYAPGLWLAPRWNNVLFDFLVEGLGRFVSFHAAEKIAVSLAILIFFWGAFAFVCAATRRAPWLLCPVIAMFSYGYSFQMGFLNFYISLGLAFFGTAIFWRGCGWERLIPVALAPLAMLAHPLGFAWLVAASAYVAIAEVIPSRYQILLVAAAGVVLLPRAIIFGTTISCRHATTPSIFSTARINCCCSARAMRFRNSRCWFSFSPHSRRIFSIVHGENFAGKILLSRCNSTSSPARRNPAARWHPLSLSAVRARALDRTAYLGFRCAALLPAQRLAAAQMAPARLRRNRRAFFHFFTRIWEPSIAWKRKSTTGAHRAAAIRAFSPRSSRPFPDRASWCNTSPIAPALATVSATEITSRLPLNSACARTPHNLYAMFNFDDAVNMEDGSYEMQPEDLPAYQIYQCSPDRKQLCIRPLAAGEMNDDLGIHPDDE